MSESQQGGSPNQKGVGDKSSAAPTQHRKDDSHEPLDLNDDLESILGAKERELEAGNSNENAAVDSQKQGGLEDLINDLGSFDIPGGDLPVGEALPDPLNDATVGFESLPDTNLDTDKSKEDQERERMQLLVSNFDEQQMARYAAFRRANIRRTAVRRYSSQLLNQPISNSVAVVLAGMSKVLIGDIIELARELQNKDDAKERAERGLPELDPSAEPDPLLPAYVREAWKYYKKETGTVPGSKIKPGHGGRMF